MVATAISIIGHEMSVLHEKPPDTVPESGIFVVRFANADDDIKATRAMARADQRSGVRFDREGNNYVNSRQYAELLRLGVPHEVISAPPSYKPPIVKMRRGKI